MVRLGKLLRSFKAFVGSAQTHQRTVLHCETLESRTLLSTSAGYTPFQIRHAYGVDRLTTFYTPSGQTAVADGTGQTIAIVDPHDNPNIFTDLDYFDQNVSLLGPSVNPNLGWNSLYQQYGPASSILTKVTPEGTPSTGTFKEVSEIALDVEWAHAIAPGAHILLVEAMTTDIKNSTNTDVLSAVDYARRYSGVTVVSMSFGAAETQVDPNTGKTLGSIESQYDSYFTTPANHIDVTFVASAGDTAGTVDYPAASPNVLSVGGTKLPLLNWYTLSDNPSTGTLGATPTPNQFGLTDPLNPESGSSETSGGISQYESKPSFQNGLSGTMRQTPDVSYDGDSSSGVEVYDNNAWLTEAGTSVGAPQWAGLIAIANNGRAANNLGSFTNTQALAALYNLPQGDFQGKGKSQTPGYDTVTGRGSPTADLVYDLGTGATAASNQRVVSHLYLDLLHRPPDPSGLSYWVNRLGQPGQSVTSVTQQIETSVEYRTQLLDSFYERYLNRVPDATGLNVFLTQMQNGQTDEGVQQQILSSAEYTSRSQNIDQLYVFGLYLDLLERVPSSNELGLWSGYFNPNYFYSSNPDPNVNQEAPAVVEGTPSHPGFLLSGEYQQDLVYSLYAMLLHRYADPSALSLWGGSLQSGATDEQVIAAIAGSQEYYNG